MYVDPVYDERRHQPRYVGFWLRTLSLFVDSVVLSVLTIALIATYFQLDLDLGLGDGLTPAERFERTWIGAMVAFQLLPWCLLAVSWWWFASSPLKLVLGIRIVDAATFARPTFLQTLLRLLGFIASALCAGIGFLWVAYDARKQGWHDKLAKTVVIYRRARPEKPGRPRP